MGVDRDGAGGPGERRVGERLVAGLPGVGDVVDLALLLVADQDGAGLDRLLRAS